MTSSTEASTSNPVDTDQQNVANTADGSVAVDDLGSPEAFLAAVDATIKYFNDGDIVSGTVVKVDRDEVLLDIGLQDRRCHPVQRVVDQARRGPL